MIVSSAFTQINSFKFHPAFFESADSQKVFLSVDGSAFFKNNEYFNKLEEGYTLPGYFIQPSLTVQFTKDFRLSAGAGFLKYSGRDGIYETEPFLRAQYQPVSWFQMIIGNIYGGHYHRLAEPMYRWEYDFTRPMESGLQFLFNSRYSEADIWLNWEKFIMEGDPFQEVLTVGISSEFYYNSKDADLSVSSPVQAIFRHHGGQINSIDTPMQTLGNWGTGITFRKNFNQNKIKYIETSLLYFGFCDFSPQKLQEYRNGFGLYPKVKTKINDFTLECGYFYGNRYLSALGDNLFHSGVVEDQSHSGNLKELITGKLVFDKKIGKAASIGAYFELYMDYRNHLSDYDYGVHFRFNPDFFLVKYH